MKLYQFVLFVSLLVAIAIIDFLVIRPAHAQTKISNLPAASSLTGVEAFPCVQSAVTDKCTVTQAVTFTYSLLSGDCTATSGGAITCTKSNGSAFAALAFKTQASLTADISGLLPIANGGNATASPGLTAGTGITLGSSWPTQSVALTVPVAIASGGTGQTTANPAFNALSPMTTIGDTIYGAASGVATRLANGTTGQCLIANTGAAPNWGSCGAGGGSNAFLRPDYSTSRWYSPIGMYGSDTVGATPAGNVIRCSPGSVGQKLTITNMGINITTLSAGGFIQLAVYSSANGLPNALIGSMNGGAGTGISTASTGFFNAALTSPVQVGPGGSGGDQALWWCSNQDNSVAVTSSVSVKPGLGAGLIGSAAGTSIYNLSSGPAGLTCSAANCNGGSSTFGTWPASLAGSTWTEPTTRIVPEPAFQPSSIP